MTRDPVGPVINAMREKYEDHFEYTIWPDGSTAKIVVILPLEQDEVSVMFLAAVIDSTFSQSMMLEFAHADLGKEQA